MYKYISRFLEIEKMSDIAKYQFNIVRDEKGGVMIFMSEKGGKVF